MFTKSFVDGVSLLPKPYIHHFMNSSSDAIMSILERNPSFPLIKHFINGSYTQPVIVGVLLDKLLHTMNVGHDFIC